jgi:hypothetical protein
LLRLIVASKLIVAYDLMLLRLIGGQITKLLLILPNCCIDLIVAYITKLLYRLIAYDLMLLRLAMDSSDTPPKHEEEDDESSVDLSMFDTEDDKSSVDLKIFDTEDSKSSDPDDCCHHIEKVSTSISKFSIFITSLIITN